MAQNYRKLVSGVPGVGTPFSLYPETINNNIEAAMTDFSGEVFPDNPAIGQKFYNTTEKVLYRYFGDAEGWRSDLTENKDIMDLTTTFAGNVPPEKPRLLQVYYNTEEKTVYRYFGNELGWQKELGNTPDFVSLRSEVNTSRRGEQTLNKRLDDIQSSYSSYATQPQNPLLGQKWLHQEGPNKYTEYVYLGTTLGWTDAVLASTLVSNIKTEVDDARGEYSSLEYRLISLASQNSSTKFPINNNYVGKPCFRTDLQSMYICKSIGTGLGGSDEWSPFTDFLPAVYANQSEIAGGRGSAPTLAARLAVSLNPDGTLKGTAPAGEWWEPLSPMSFTKVSENVMEIEGDVTAVFEPERAVLFTPSSKDKVWVTSSTFDGTKTTITLSDYILDNDTGVQFGAPVGNHSYVSANILVSTPTSNVPSTMAIGFEYDISFTATPALPGAQTSYFYVRINNEPYVSLEAVENTATFKITPEGVDGDVYRLTVYAIDNIGGGNRSDFATFESKIVEEPVRPSSIQSPTESQIDVLLTPTISVSEFGVKPGLIDTPAYVQIQVARDLNFVDVIADSGETVTSGNTWVVSEQLPTFTSLYARARWNGSRYGLGSWGATRSFRTIDAYIKAPVITGLIDGQVDVLPRVSINVGQFDAHPSGFDTPKATDNFYYQFIKSDTNEVIESNTVTLSATGGVIRPSTNLPLVTNITLYCRWIGNILTTGITKQLSFTTTDAFIMAPTYSGISNGAVNVHPSPKITISDFEAVPEGHDQPKQTDNFKYTFKNTDTGVIIETGFRTFTGGVGGDLTPTKKLPIITPITLEMEWLGDILTSGTTTVNFTTVNAYTNQPEVLTPTEGQSGVMLTPSITLSEFTNVGPIDTATGTKIQVATDAAFTNIVEDVNGAYITSFTVTTPLDLETIYYVRAAHGGALWGFSEWSSTRKFTTTKAYVDKPVIIVPTTYLRRQVAEVVTAPFSGAGTVHTSTDWRITDKNTDNVIVEALNSPDKLAHTFNLGVNDVTDFEKKAAWYSVIYANGKFVAVGGKPIVIQTTVTETKNHSGMVKTIEHSRNNPAINSNYEVFLAIKKPDGYTDYINVGVHWDGGVAVFEGAATPQHYISLGRIKRNRIHKETSGGNNNDGSDKYFLTQSIVYAPPTNANTTHTINGFSISLGALTRIPKTAMSYYAYTQDIIISGGSISREVKASNPGYAGVASTSIDGITWTPLVQIGGDNSFMYNTAYGNGKFVTVGDNGKTSTSVDGITWTSPVQVSGVTDFLYSIAYGNGKFVAVGDSGFASTSVDGITWTPASRISGMTSFWTDITYDKGKFVVVGVTGFTSTSIDGVTWTPLVQIGGIASNWSYVAYGNGKFVVVGYDGFASTSVDGITWAPVVRIGSELAPYWTNITYGNGKFVVVGYNGFTSTSVDGITWTPASQIRGMTTYWRGVTYGNGKFVFNGDNGRITSMFDLVKKDQVVNVTAKHNATLNGVNFDTSWSDVREATITDVGFVVVGVTGFTSTSIDGVTWTPLVQVSGKRDLNSVTYGNGKFVAVGFEGNTSTSVDGGIWTPTILVSGVASFTSVTYGNGKFVAVGFEGNTSTSVDGITWTPALQVSGAAGVVLNSATYANGKFVVVGYNGVTSTSVDGITWTPVVRIGSELVTYWNYVAYGNGKFVAVGSNGFTSTSVDGITWTSPVQVSGNKELNSVTYGKGKFVAVGFGGCTSTSVNGITWTSPVLVSGVTSFTSVTYRNGKFVAVGSNGFTSTSVDGITWTSPVQVNGMTSYWRGISF